MWGVIFLLPSGLGVLCGVECVRPAAHGTAWMLFDSVVPLLEWFLTGGWGHVWGMGLPSRGKSTSARCSYLGALHPRVINHRATLHPGPLMMKTALTLRRTWRVRTSRRCRPS